MWGPCQHFQDFLFLFTLKIVLNDLGYMFRVIVLRKNTFGANHTPPCNQIIIIIRIKSTILFTEMQPQTCIILHASLLSADTHKCTALQPFGGQTSFYFSQVFKIWTYQSSTCFHFSAPLFQCLHALLSHLDLFPHGRFVAASLPSPSWRPLNLCIWVAFCQFEAAGQ